MFKVPMLKSSLYNFISMKKEVWGNELVYHKVSFSALTNEENHQHFRICSEGKAVEQSAPAADGRNMCI